MDGWNGTENPEIGPHKYVQVIVDNNMQSDSTGERQTSTEGAGTNGLKRKKKSTETSYLIQKVHQNRSYSTCKMKDNKISRKKFRKKSSRLRTRQRVLRLVTKSTIHKTELTYWPSSN